MKRILVTLALAAMLLVFGAGSALALELEVTSGVLIDATTGRIIYEQNAYQQLPPASTTKVFTALLVLENVTDLDATVTLPADFANVGESSIYLQPGDTMTFRDLLYALMLRSANDAGQALAIGVSGSEKAFVELMNSRAAELGLNPNSYWVNAHGLDLPSNMVTAYDLALITQEALKYDLFNEIITTESYVIKFINSSKEDITLANHNMLLERYEYADGVKTGYTSVAGSCLSASATKDGVRFIGVVMGGNPNGTDNDYYNEMIRMMDYGFSQSDSIHAGTAGYVVDTIKVSGGRLKQVEVILGDDVFISIASGQTYTPKVEYNIPDSINAPFTAGTQIGTATYTDSEGNKVTVPVLTAEGSGEFNFRLAFAEVWQRFTAVLLGKAKAQG